ncbi:DNA mismatch repair protein Msh6 [Pyronema domesticum]|uniref:DNA mismatch repair protein n=1 Tax=Pyronema omphalodes (strain CBS 100304) TaxID=1076935 RepID=U4L081_PYROM|nr:DNA mismatch repair protein Msh6 [Pyronema domesticum]CCX07944.1 Similar to DNA mismatch repair protein msh6; acc. no. O74502 [Pyronema omphalodes CBS 100304]
MVDKTPGKSSGVKKSTSVKKGPTPSGQKTLLSFFGLKSGVAKAVTPAPEPISSDPILPSSPIAPRENDGRPSFMTQASPRKQLPILPSSPVPVSRTSKKVSYAESDDEEDFKLRAPKRRKQVISDDEDDDLFVDAAEASEASVDDDGDDFVVDDDSDVEIGSKRKRKTTKAVPKTPVKPKVSAKAVNNTGLTPATSRFAFTPGKGTSATPARTPAAKGSQTPGATPKPAGKGDKDMRYSWLVDVCDADKNPKGHEDYDPRTLYIPAYQWAKFSPFEKQYWEIKSKLYDTVVFFKKGKFYELYEDDARIGHQEFDLKLTDRVNMSMVGVPESSLDMWASQFIAKGYKIARVDQAETALGKEMREKGAKISKEDKIIKRELACVLTGGTLVDEAMLQDDMSTYCVAIKEDVSEDLPVFGIAFVDTATGAFSLTEFVDDVDLTKFETFVAQIRPKELILEKGCISSRAIRILKNNTSLTTLWNKIKPVSEFWDCRTTLREIDAGGYFDNEDSWPEVLQSMKKNDNVMSAFGGLLYYLQSLKIARELVTLKNFQIYDPVKKATSLVLDGKTLLNLEIFANSYDGSAAGTLFPILNKCITPFGKRMLKQWVCHPLADASKINARLDAIDALNANDTFRDVFTSQLSQLPDLERLISRIHAGTTKAADFLRVLEGFERIMGAIEEIKAYGEGEGLIGQLLGKVPDLGELLKPWESAFDRQKVKDNGVLVPEPGVETDFDESQETIEGIQDELRDLLKKYQKDLGCKDLKYVDVGKETYTVEVPQKYVKSVPKTWGQTSGTAKCKRFYSPELQVKVRSLQEAQEIHSQIVKQVAGRFYERFDEHYAEWLLTVQIVANLDCLIGLAKASQCLGDVSCRPTFVEEERTVLDFEELRHPCMTTSVDDFIPNDIQLGGERPKITLLTGANAAGKSTVLRMTCIGVIMAQVGCYVPAKSARLTPIDRIMSRLGANDNIFAAQSTFFVELSETKKILSDATDRSLVILDELGRGTSSYDGVAVAQSVLHHVATHIGCVGYFATHYHSLADEFSTHPEIRPCRMQIDVDNDVRDITFLYKLEEGVAEGSFGMHCAAKCGINKKIIDRAEVAAKAFEHTSKLKDSLEAARVGTYIPLGLQSDVALLLSTPETVTEEAMEAILRSVECL